MNNIFVLVFAISFLCIPVFILAAVISLIRKRPAKKRFKLAGISSLILLASLIGGAATMDEPIPPTYIQLSIPDYQDMYGTNTIIPISISVIPEDADTSSLEYIASGESLAFSDTGVITGPEEGSFDIHVKSGDIASNTLTINVQNANAHKQAAAEELAKAEAENPKATEEQAAKEAEQQRLAEEQAAKEAEQKRLEAEKAAAEAEQQRLAAEQAAKEAEQKRLAEEQAAKEAEQKRLAEEQAAKEAEQKKRAEEQAAREAEQKRLEAEEAERKRLAEEQFIRELEQQQAQAYVVPEPSTPSSASPSGDGSNFNAYDNASQQATSAAYVLNTSSKKIHYPSCRSVKKIAPQNYATSNSTVSELIGQGYTTCGNCF